LKRLRTRLAGGVGEGSDIAADFNKMDRPRFTF
jgi:hypothetical protein